MSKKRVAVLISGRGSNLQALLDADQSAYEVVLVVSNVPGAAGLERARAAGVEALELDHKPYGKNREAFERDLDALLVQRNIQLVALAGFMRVLTSFFVRAWTGRLVNIHPSLLPKFPGTKTHERALEAGETEHGATVHLVVDEVDAGEIIGQASMPILPGDTPTALAERLLAVEHKLYPRCLAALASRLN
ncbi:phosphoribosylglycinamide formyltransferase [Candidatus Viadribacter manganicus]|uniref:Phosphoribosylglycinamide formyltransferase n=1 Tax=Candidatus Viadribacter manganicus TaxID=1759059 RepID=A0A1B1ADX6_9PROT|nr:phosphoribosylglycinamide formyltransferase [Candidatus Viadribacter manganicus]ANP44760.1 phosphoribosylglycinamide formyltransferase [Candidatus Viadribacter manganicus]